MGLSIIGSEGPPCTGPADADSIGSAGVIRTTGADVFKGAEGAVPRTCSHRCTSLGGAAAFGGKLVSGVVKRLDKLLW
jgi:hypothetical protein